MRLTFALLAAAVAVQASPIALPGGVTAKISPKQPPPSGCKGTYAQGTFGIAVMNVSTTSKEKNRAVSTISDGQPQEPTQTSVVVVSTISDGQPQAPTSAALVSTISDGQPQAPTSVVAVSTISDGQPQAPTSVVAVSTISDGQPQAPTVITMAPVSQITDGQIQGGMHTVTMMPVTQISDGQIQATVTYMPVTVISDGQPQAPTIVKTTVKPVSTISDGQPQAPTTVKESAVSTISDGQPQAPTATKTAVTTISDSQPQAPTSAAASASASSTSTSSTQMVACKGNSTLEITLAGGVMTDNKGRTGYIASNYQFQFDKPPQAGAIYTAGWSVCANGSIALGGSNIFYQCLSGSFYNLYNKDWAAQCSPVTIETLMLVSCS